MRIWIFRSVAGIFVIVLIDNYDSFTYNLYQAFCSAGHRVKVFRNDAVTVEQVARMQPTHVVISPGPGTPRQAGISKELIWRLRESCRILGVCLGHQSLNEVFGGSTIRAATPCHGKTTVIRHDGKGIYTGLPATVEVARYHSLVVDPQKIPSALQVTAWTEDGIVMGLRHCRYALEGVQFHPESFLTPAGEAMLKNYADS